MKGVISVVFALLLIAGIAFAEDGNSNTDTNQIACTIEGNTMPVYPGYACCEGLNAIPTTSTSSTGEITTLVGASICSKCGNNECEQWENYANCPSDCNTTPTPQANDVNETIKCIFSGNTTSQTHSCKADNGVSICSGINDCKVAVSGPFGKKLLWTSTCSGNQSTNLDGTSEEIKFDCSGINNCFCTKEYNPVCGSNGITYGNACTAKCASVEVAYEGKCAEIEPTPSTGDFYKNAYWKCSNGKEFKESSDKCLPYSYWKEKTRKTCAAMNTKCITKVIPETISSQSTTASSTPDGGLSTTATSASGGSSSGGGSSTSVSTASVATGNLIATTAVTPATTRTTNTIAISSNKSSVNTSTETQTNTSSSTAIPVLTTTNPSSITSTNAKCIGGEVGVIDFRVSDQCRPECKEYTDEKGCTVTECSNKITSTVCPTSQCYVQSWDEIRNLKDKCYLEGNQVIINFENGCNVYKCIDSTKPSIDPSTVCLTKDQIPQEKIDYCEKNGGQFAVKANGKGCIVVAECIGETNSTTETKPINKEILTDKTKLLSLALMLETLRIDLQKTEAKIRLIADYYTQTGDTTAAAKFNRAADLINTAVSGVDEVKKKIRNNIDTFNEDDALIARNKIKDIRETILKEALLAMLG